MKCICLRACTVRIKNKSYYYAKNEVAEFDKCPTHFSAIEEQEIDFNIATLELLLESSSWTYPKAEAWLKSNGVTVTGPKLSKREMAQKIVDTRSRKVTIPEV